jgi:hypothetical protein
MISLTGKLWRKSRRYSGYHRAGARSSDRKGIPEFVSHLLAFCFMKERIQVLHGVYDITDTCQVLSIQTQVSFYSSIWTKYCSYLHRPPPPTTISRISLPFTEYASSWVVKASTLEAMTALFPEDSASAIRIFGVLLSATTEPHHHNICSPPIDCLVRLWLMCCTSCFVDSKIFIFALIDVTQYRVHTWTLSQWCDNETR